MSSTHFFSISSRLDASSFSLSNCRRCLICRSYSSHFWPNSDSWSFILTQNINSVLYVDMHNNTVWYGITISIRQMPDVNCWLCSSDTFAYQTINQNLAKWQVIYCGQSTSVERVAGDIWLRWKHVVTFLFWGDMYTLSYLLNQTLSFLSSPHSFLPLTNNYVSCYSYFIIAK